MISRQTTGRFAVAIAVVMSLMVAGAAPASSANVAMQSEQLVVGSQHTDFGTGDEPNPQTLDNFSVDGSGDSASVVFSTSTYHGMEEDGDLSEYGGDTSAWDAATSPVSNGSYSIQGSASTTGYTIASTDTTLQQGDTIQWQGHLSATSARGGLFFATQAEVGESSISGYYTELHGDSITIYRADDGSYTNLNGNSSVSLPANEFVSATTDWQSDGTITVTVKDSSGTVVGTVSATDSTYTSGGVGMRVFNGTTTIDGIKTGGGGQSGTYVSATHEVSNPEEAAINIEQHSNVSVEATVRTDGGTVLNQTTIGGTGNHTLTLADTSSDQLETVLEVDVTGDDPALSLGDESILFTNHAPEADNLDPPDGTETTQNTVTFSVDVSDQEFPTAQGDSVTAELFVGGDSAGSETVTSNSTVEIDHQMTEGGERDYYWELTDSYGATTTTSTRTITVPNTLYLYTETQNSTGYHELLDDVNTSVEVTITGSQGSVKAVEVDDGTVDMTGLPADESYVFTIDPEGYHAREIYISSIFDQSAVFLLNKTHDSVENSLTVTDRTGEFENPIITVERVINTSRVPEMTSNGDQWVTIGGDRLGASGFYIVNLQASSRYRFVVINQAGGTRVLGEYTAKADGEVPLEIGSITYDLSPEDNAYQWTTAATNESGNPALSFAYSDGSNTTEWVNVTFRYRNNSSVVASKNFTTGPYGEVVFTEPVNSSVYDSEDFVVDWTANRNGTLVEGERIIGGKRDVRPPLADVWMEIAYGGGVFILAFVAGAGIGAPAAAVTVAVFSAVSVFMGLAPPALGFPATILALFLAIAMMVFAGRQEV